MTEFDGFPEGCLPFLQALGKNNDREWFKENKQRFELEVQGPALAFNQTGLLELADQLLQIFQ